MSDPANPAHQPKCRPIQYECDHKDFTEAMQRPFNGLQYVRTSKSLFAGMQWVDPKNVNVANPRDRNRY